MLLKNRLLLRSQLTIGTFILSALFVRSAQAGISASDIVDPYEAAACASGTTNAAQRWAYFLASNPSAMGKYAFMIGPSTGSAGGSHVAQQIDQFIAATLPKYLSGDEKDVEVATLSKLADILVASNTAIDEKGLIIKVQGDTTGKSMSELTKERVVAFFQIIETGTSPQWLTVQCSPADSTIVPPPVVPLLSMRIAANEKGTQPRKLGDRDFATISFSRDGAASTNTAGVKGAIAIILAQNLFSANSEGYVFSELDYSRTGREEPTVDDLSFGGTLSFVEGQARTKWLIWPAFHSLTGRWQTDTDFEVSVPTLEYRAQFGGGFFEQNRCKFDFGCVFKFSFVADYGNVTDPGDNAALAAIGDYGRLGLDAGFHFQYETANESNWEFDVKNESRFSVTSSNADASLTTVALGLTPSKASRFKFTLEYQDGKTLRSFSPIETISFNIGVRY